MKICIVGYDIRALSLSRILIKDGHSLHLIPGFSKKTFNNLKNYKLPLTGLTLYEQVKESEYILSFVKKINPDLTICLHIESYSIGLVELLKKHNFLVFGINTLGSSLETSKIKGVQVAKDCGLFVPTTTYVKKENKKIWLDTFNLKHKIVIKENGLAGGRGTTIIENKAHLKKIIEKTEVNFIVQDFIEGEEVALSLLISGNNIYLLNINFEIKREYDNDKGDNTPGMATVARNTYDLNNKYLINKILKKLPFYLFDIGYNGPIDVNFIIDQNNNFIFIEFTCRFGDPELSSEILLLKNITKLFYDTSNNFPLNNFQNNHKWSTGIVARNINNFLDISNYEENKFVLDILDFNEYNELCISSVGNNYLKLLEKTYSFLNKNFNNIHFRTDVYDNVNIRWNRLVEVLPELEYEFKGK